jgi:hypothetical protein
VKRTFQSKAHRQNPNPRHRRLAPAKRINLAAETAAKMNATATTLSVRGDEHRKPPSPQSKSTPTRSTDSSPPKPSATNAALKAASPSARLSKAPWRQRSTSLCTTPPLSRVPTRTLRFLLRGAEAEGGSEAVLLGTSLRLRVDRARSKSRSRSQVLRSRCRSWRRRLCWRMRRRMILHGAAASKLRRRPLSTSMVSRVNRHQRCTVEKAFQSRLRQCMQAYETELPRDHQDGLTKAIDVPVRRRFHDDFIIIFFLHLH